MAKSIYETGGVGGVVFVLALLLCMLGLKLNNWLSVGISAIAGLVAWQMTKGK